MKRQTNVKSPLDRNSRGEYLARIHRVLDYLMTHLGDELSLEIQAREACFSPWHYHRIFTSLMEETPDDYVRRLRLEKAASMLGSTRSSSVTEAALLCGFSTPALFSRNFRKHFGVSPSDWQRGLRGEREKESKNRQEVDKNGQAFDPEIRYSGIEDRQDRREPELPVEIKRLAPLRVAYVWHLQGYFKGTTVTYGRLQKWARVRGLITPDTRFLCVYFDNPNITPEDKCRFLACVTLPKAAEVETGTRNVGFTEIPGGLYACWNYKGHGRYLKDRYHDFYARWLPDSGVVPGDGSGFMRHVGSMENWIPTELDCEICIPVTPL